MKNDATTRRQAVKVENAQARNSTSASDVSIPSDFSTSLIRKTRRLFLTKAKAASVELHATEILRSASALINLLSEWVIDGSLDSLVSEIERPSLSSQQILSQNNKKEKQDHESET